jgi:hypothetical protein
MEFPKISSPKSSAIAVAILASALTAGCAQTKAEIELTQSCSTSPSLTCPEGVYGVGGWRLGNLRNPDSLSEINEQTGMHTITLSTNSDYVVSELETARAAGWQLILRMSGDDFLTDGQFDIDKWESAVRTLDIPEVHSAIANGTLIGHMLLDDIVLVDGLEPWMLDEIARISTEIFGDNIFSFVRADATEVEALGPYEYQDLKMLSFQYTESKAEGDPNAYARINYEAAARLDIPYFDWGINVVDGSLEGDVEGTIEGRFMMTPDLVKYVATTLMDFAEGGVRFWMIDNDRVLIEGGTSADRLLDPASEYPNVFKQISNRAGTGLTEVE